jgi:hypothetical protein
MHLLKSSSRSETSLRGSGTFCATPRPSSERVLLSELVLEDRRLGKGLKGKRFAGP